MVNPEKKQNGDSATTTTDARWCMDCNKKFSSVNRKHRCRVCNNAFCADCAPRNNQTGDKNYTRVCHACLPHLQFCMNKPCAKAFTGIRRRHHCRVCGLIFCQDCCPKATKGAVPRAEGTVTSVQACSKCTTKFSVTKRRHFCRRCDLVFCDSCCPKISGERVCAACKDQDKLSDAEVLTSFASQVVLPSLPPHVQTGLRELPLLTKRQLVSLYAQSPRHASFSLADDPSFWGCILGTDSKSPSSPPSATQLQRLRVLLAAAEDSWVEDLIDLTGLSPFITLLANADLQLQIGALACITGLATTRTGLQAVVASSELAEAVVQMLSRATNVIKIACLDLLTLLCWSSPQGREAVVEAFSLHPPKYKMLVDSLNTSTETPDMRLLLVTLLFINVVINTVMVTPDQQETLTRQLAVLQEFQLVGLDLGLISHLEDLCANDSQARDPTYELQVQCDAFRAKARQRQGVAAKAEAEGEEKSARSARAQLMKKMRRESRGKTHNVADSAFVFAECRHTSLASVVQGMLRRTPRNIHTLDLLRTIERHKQQVSVAEVEQLALSEFTTLFYCGGEEDRERWKCACSEDDDCSRDGQRYDDGKALGAGSLVPNECVVGTMKCFLSEGGLTLLYNWFVKELESPWQCSTPVETVIGSVPFSPLPSTSCVSCAPALNPSTSPSAAVVFKLTSIFWSFANLLDLNVLPSCHAFSHAASPMTMPQECDAGSRWVSVMIRTAPLSPIRLISRGGLLAWLHRVALKHVPNHSLHPCLLEALVTLLATGELMRPSSDAATSLTSSSSTLSQSWREKGTFPCPSAILCVLAVLPAISTHLSVNVLRSILPCFPSNLKEGGLSLLLQTLPNFSEPVRVECLRELIALVSKNSAVALGCAVDHPRWLEHLHILLSSPAEKASSAGLSQSEKAGSAGVFELALGFMGMVLHKHFMGTSTIVSFTQMFIDALYDCGLTEEKGESTSRHVWSPSAVDLCRRTIEAFVAFTSKNSLTQWKGTYSHPAWPNFLSLLALLKRVCIHGTKASDFLAAKHFSPAAPSPQTVELVSEVALQSLWKLMESLNLDASG